MRTPTRGAVYEGPSGEPYECIKSPDTMGVPTHKAESMEIEFRSLADGGWLGIAVDDYGSNWRFVAESAERFEKQNGDGLTEAEAAEIRERARESWGRLANEYGVDEDTVRDVIVG